MFYNEIKDEELGFESINLEIECSTMGVKATVLTVSSINESIVALTIVMKPQLIKLT